MCSVIHMLRSTEFHVGVRKWFCFAGFEWIHVYVKIQSEGLAPMLLGSFTYMDHQYIIRGLSEGNRIIMIILRYPLASNVQFYVIVHGVYTTDAPFFVVVLPVYVCRTFFLKFEWHLKCFVYKCNKLFSFKHAQHLLFICSCCRHANKSVFM